MKFKTHFWTAAVLVVSLAAAVAAQNSPANTGQSSAGTVPANADSIVVKGVKGRVFAVSPTGRSIRVREGMVLPEGFTIQTKGAESFVDLFLKATAATVRLGGDSDLKIDKVTVPTTGPNGLTTKPEVKLTLNSGEIVGNATGMKDDAKFQVVTSRGIVEVKPSEFAIKPGAGLVVKSGVAYYTTSNVVDGRTATTRTQVAANQQFTPAAPTSANRPANTPPPQVQPIPAAVSTALASQFNAVANIELASTQPPGTKPPVTPPAGNPPNSQIGGGGNGVPNTTTFDQVVKSNSPR